MRRHAIQITVGCYPNPDGEGLVVTMNGEQHIMDRTEYWDNINAAVEQRFQEWAKEISEIVEEDVTSTLVAFAPIHKPRGYEFHASVHDSCEERFDD